MSGTEEPFAPADLEIGVTFQPTANNARHLTTQEELTLKSHFLVRPPPRPPRKGRLAGGPEPPLEEEDLLLFLPRSCTPELNFLFWLGHRARASEDEHLSGEAGSS
jgi:hypothetical protein